MNDENIKLWRASEKTNPEHTKQVNFGRKITAIDPYRQLEAATMAFGPAGKGWGWDVKQVEYLTTNEVCILISLWHGSPNDKGRVEQWGQASLFIDKAEKKKDTDCMKKATTDGITKCLSCLGFNADIFLGKFDDNKYVQEMKDTFNPPAPAPEKTMHDLLKDAILKAGHKNLPSWCKMAEIEGKEAYEALTDSEIDEYLTSFSQGTYNV